MIRQAVPIAVVATLAFALGVAVGVAIQRLPPSAPAATAPDPVAILLYDAGGTPRVFGPMPPWRANLARRGVGGRIVPIIDVP